MSDDGETMILSVVEDRGCYFATLDPEDGQVATGTASRTWGIPETAPEPPHLSLSEQKVGMKTWGRSSDPEHLPKITPRDTRAVQHPRS